MGLLGTSWEDPQSQGLLALASGMMQGNIGKGVSDMSTTMAGAQDMALKRKLLEMQMQTQALTFDRQKQDWAREDQIRALAPQYYSKGSAGMPAQAAIPGLSASTSAMPSMDSLLPPEMQVGQPARAAVAPTPASFDSQGYASALMGIDPKQGMAEFAALRAQNAPIKVGDGDSIVDPKTFKPLYTHTKVAAIPAAITEYKFAVSQGYPGTFQQFGLENKRAGASNISTKIENKMGEGVASQIGPMIKDSYIAANGASQQMDAAKRIIQAVDSGKIISGPGAGTRMTIAQIGQTLGVGGKDDAELIANSRQVIRGLSEMTLQGRKQMSGQGAITESEGILAEKATSGRIEDLTTAEIRQLAAASARASKFIYAQHENNLSNLSSDPNTAKLAPFYKPMPFPVFNTDAAQPPAARKVSIADIAATAKASGKTTAEVTQALKDKGYTIGGN